ncbi:hypothetical protein [Burkholderia multivorans]|uniref:hypothetical protein n=1 Tax=Burkholderia multivorans TaxID=87883 RepID=UPI000AE7926C|nr:hypothetical protein [Burkholderia multivorans]MBR7923882.1 hypothetical protein [Burkholderia multivorans]MBR8104896.1 hypothetical protein [Burkholderia multivorans]MBR8340312.1 hypothetical protein [Burkholderia multivorans]MBU9432575.1 DUF4276 family protein [Burkholderia multivorans]MBU9460722.1 DUF4276 family protein [Burkholderia multivorans]
MQFVRYTLLADGSSDSALLPIIQWVIEQNFPGLATIPEFARNGIPAPSEGLRRRVDAALGLYACDVLFVHRDAERDDPNDRRAQIANELGDLETAWIPVIPVRMTEAWLLGDERAIRKAAENPNGKIGLAIPPRARWETLPDPKKELFRLLHLAADRPARRAINEGQCRHRVAALTADFSHLRALPSFQAFEEDVTRVFGAFED